ncbi:HlyD family secretion protein [Mucilaginibacter pocheonensis]|uniref:Membrane fusion protein (Multidrug efflux system) n=1 Tax=Mucilaginibacter pocheonensis TaxID=398050 RepID=A0ABU1TEG0_9SPHI|nr:HlyD family secretion protein [Mucilaginibacter pocheonensis]MDR6943733.1 membrane fusion protein (multidrug efflux system) [Mucilaginibacter pocheonensis]
MVKQTNYTTTDKLITRITTMIAGLIAICLLIWGIITIRHWYAFEETDDAQVEAYINPVTARVSGFIKEIRYNDNQEVKKGDTLLIIDNNEYQLNREQSVAGLQTSKEQVRALQANIETAEKAAEVNKALIGAAKSKLTRQQQEYDRYKKLLEAESATKEQMENIESELEVATSNYQAAVHNYEVALSKVMDSKAQIAPVMAEINRRDLVLKRTDLDVNYTVVTAPYNGRIGRRTIQPGQQIQIGQTLAYIVDKNSGLWVVANFKETQLHNMHIGQTVNIVADAYPDKEIKGKILSWSPATGARFSLLPPDNSTGNFVKIAQRIPVKIQIDLNDPAQSFLSAGMNANVAVPKN